MTIQHSCKAWRIFRGPLVLACASFLLASSHTALAAPDPADTAAAIDKLMWQDKKTNFLESAKSHSSESLCDDATFLRRVSLDVVGDLPTPEQLTSFAFDPAENKRELLIDALLSSPHYGQNWARYWRDVILYRRMEDRALLVSNALVVYLTKELNAGRPWDEIAREFITAKGDIRDDGRTAIFAAQDGKTAETTAEMARIFLGMQIQCSQCHDDISGRWTREEFHELAAFFPRVAVRPVRSPTKRSLIVAVDDNVRNRGRRPNNNRRRGNPEHYMPDLENPKARGTKMTPKFFLTGATLEFGTKDAERRETLAQWMTENPWFAKSQVNRIWAELVGAGFYDPIDDLGPERDCKNREGLELLATRFGKNDFDMKWLIKTILLTKEYQTKEYQTKEYQNREDPSDNALARITAKSQRLRADQLYNCVTSALETSEKFSGGKGRSGQGHNTQRVPRFLFNQTFGYDPSDPRDEVTSSIPQALSLMNSPQINSQINGRNRKTMLAQLIRETNDPVEVTEELYLRVLAREPNAEEIQECVAYIRRRKNKVEGFEDVLWVLLNSAELLHRN